MGTIDWEDAQKNYGYKNYAKPGIYTVKCADVEIREVGQNGSIAQDFIFEEDDKKYPKATHWLTFKEGKDGWRQWHNLQLMIVLGSSEETAKKAIEKIEALEGKNKIVKGYEAAYKALLKKNPTVEIEVYQDGDYTRAEFTDGNVAMPHDSKPAQKTDDVAPEDIEGDEVDLSTLDMPF